ncbi:MAG: division/cell wall cluster transcriptional repressor MraZ, partial [Clostridia bacterium]|nr:division/cell wall cluster transcriptional repressor MraZ [Clostridia bacterium]
IDKKGRIFIPAKLRDSLGENFVISRGIGAQPVLSIYSEESWQQLDEKIKALPNMESLRVRRFLYTGAMSAEYDSQGRIVIPSRLREFADLGENAYVLGMSDHLEIWNTQLWESESVKDTSASIADIMTNLQF